MKRSISFSALSLVPSASFAASLLQPGNSLAIDTSPVPSSTSPSPRYRPTLFDGNSATKYHEFWRGAFGFHHHAECADRRPFRASFSRPQMTPTCATRRAIPSQRHQQPDRSCEATASAMASRGTLIQAGGRALPFTRQTAGSSSGRFGRVPYSSYLMVFDTVKNAASANRCRSAMCSFSRARRHRLDPALRLLDSIRAFDLACVELSDHGRAGQCHQRHYAKFLHSAEAGSGFITTSRASDRRSMTKL